MKFNNSLLLALIVVAGLFLFMQIYSIFSKSFLYAKETNYTSKSTVQSIDLQQIINEVLPPEGYESKAVWGNIVQDMIKAGILDKEKLRATLKQRYGQDLTPEMEEILNTPNLNKRIRIDKNNAVFMMYILGIIAKHNNNSIIHNSPFKIPDIFSEAGRDGWGDVNLIKLTPEQQAIAEYVANNAYRPCCGQPTSRPDCTHGFSLLGLIYIMASQGFSKEEIFRDALYFNAHWFPRHYTLLALYFKVKENKDWKEVNPELALSAEYSTVIASRRIEQELRSMGII
ncbi:MAG: hypothetical protein QXQ14_03295 [Candidatus Aenigmatarchaeota archaeon]